MVELTAAAIIVPLLLALTWGIWLELRLGRHLVRIQESHGEGRRRCLVTCCQGGVLTLNLSGDTWGSHDLAVTAAAARVTYFGNRGRVRFDRAPDSPGARR